MGTWEMMTITLSYGICMATPWNHKYDSVGTFTFRERKTPEELKQEREFLKSYGKKRKPAPYRFTEVTLRGINVSFI